MFPDTRHLLPIIIIGGSFAFTGAILYGSWLLGRYRGREETMPDELAAVDARLYRLEQAMTNVSKSLDRLEAAHRITARMLADTPSDPARLPRRAVTPH